LQQNTEDLKQESGEKGRRKKIISFINAVLEFWGLSLIPFFKDGGGRPFRNVLVCISYQLYWRIMKFILVPRHLLLSNWES